ncbi:hypothetical protein BC829DRAFT_378166 [Chytridium lagenaria]|nr:hypothetical protein BC829DRAFT_378166 [Chytridium lagenaria]
MMVCMYFYFHFIFVLDDGVPLLMAVVYVVDGRCSLVLLLVAFPSFHLLDLGCAAFGIAILFRGCWFE